MFNLLVEVGFLPFYVHRFFKFNVAAGSRNNPVCRMFDSTLNFADVLKRF